MTEYERLAKVKRELEELSKTIARLKELDVDAALDAAISRKGARRDAMDRRHGPVIYRARDGIFEPGYERPVVEAKPGPPVDSDRGTTQMGAVQQRKMIGKMWKFRSFRRCGNCGNISTYQSRNPSETEGFRVWCYTCGSRDDAVTSTWEGPPEVKYRPTACAVCGKVIELIKGEKCWPTGDKDPHTGKPDYACEACRPTTKR